MEKNKLTNQDIISFLINAYFGNVDDPVHTAANSAYLDLNRTIEFKTGKSLSKEAKDKLRLETVRLIKDQTLNMQTIGEIDQETYNSWHRKLCMAIVQKYTDSEVRFYYGQAQKWVNMTMKYLSVILPEATSGFFECLHVPIDTIVMDKAYEQFGIPRSGQRWSRMSEDEYSRYQVTLNRAIRERIGYAPLLWEFRSWNR